MLTSPGSLTCKLVENGDVKYVLLKFVFQTSGLAPQKLSHQTNFSFNHPFPLTSCVALENLNFLTFNSPSGKKIWGKIVFCEFKLNMCLGLWRKYFYISAQLGFFEQILLTLGLG